MIGKDGSQIRFDRVSDLSSDCNACSAETQTRMFCPEHRAGRACNWCAGRGWRTSSGRWAPCNCQKGQ